MSIITMVLAPKRRMRTKSTPSRSKTAGALSFSEARKDFSINSKYHRRIFNKNPPHGGDEILSLFYFTVIAAVVFTFLTIIAWKIYGDPPDDRPSYRFASFAYALLFWALTLLSIGFRLIFGIWPHLVF